MKPGIPWSVKGIDSEAREAAKHAARRSGMTLGEWLNTVIREQAEEAEPPRRPPARNAMHDIQSKLDSLSEQLTRMARREQDTTAGRHYERSRPAPQQSLADILARVEASERQATENFAQFSERLETLGDKFSQGLDSFPRDPEDVPGYRSLETAVRNIVDHIEVSERKTRDTLKAVQDRLNDVAHAASVPIDGDRLLADAPLIARIESRIADLTSRVTDKNEGIRNDLHKVVQAEFGKLAGRIDSVKQAAEASAQRAQAQAVELAQTDLRDFESRVEGVLEAAQAAPQELARLRAEMESLGQRVDDLRAEAASEHDLRSLRMVIEQLSARVAQGPDLRPLADLDRRLTEISKWLEQGRGDHVGNQIADLEQRVFDLDNRIAEAMRRDQGAHAWGDVEREFAGLSDRLANTEQQLRHIATLEQSIQQLYQSMEQSRDWARDVAEDAANRMASRLMQDWPAKAPGAGPSPELQALETALETVRANYETADRRNQETLGAVHETLEQIVNKLTELEQFRGESAAESEPALAAGPAFAPAPEISAAPEEPQSWDDHGGEAAPDPYRPLDPPVPQAAEPVAPSVQHELIAAARRAAQAAAQQTPGPQASSPGGKAQKPVSRFSLRFRRRPKPVPAAEAGAFTAGKDDPGKRRRLILIGLVLLAAASALAYDNFFRKPADAPATPARVEESKPSTGNSSMLGNMNRTIASSLSTVLAKSDALLAKGDPASALPGGVETRGGEVAIDDAEALPSGIGTESLRQAALDGDPAAAFVVASRFAEGKGVAADLKAAARWYGVAAAKGLAPAQYRLGALLERGKGVAADADAARRWYEQAAAAGNVRAMHNAAVLFANGRKSEIDYEKAARWFEEAAGHDLKDSQFNIAVLYERGLGVHQDLGEALFWYSLAARQNDQDAAVKMKTLESTLPGAVRAEVKARLAKWTPKPDVEKANIVAITNPAWQDLPVVAPAGADVFGSAIRNVVGGNPVAEAQTLLDRLGFDVGEIDGTLGSRTRNSIRLFELQSGMRISGEVTSDLLSRLRAKAG
ncbi:MAG: peptidoglycan-binding protein [Parvibaculaceae bacterium]